MQRNLSLKDWLNVKVDFFTTKLNTFKGTFQYLRLKCRKSALSVPTKGIKYDFAHENSENSPYTHYKTRSHRKKITGGGVFHCVAKSTRVKQHIKSLNYFNLNLTFWRFVSVPAKSNIFKI